ncbi:MAG TPA: NAD(P) transhydrogenase subunit alpha [Bacteroidota bacterium]|nr:NAD(P) transhydrogenase subunit alpha [Bacteroidota bacterium]
MKRVSAIGLGVLLVLLAVRGFASAQDAVPAEPSTLSAPAAAATTPAPAPATAAESTHAQPASDYWSDIFVFVLATFIGMGVIARVSRLLHTPLMSLTNAISAIAVVGAIIVTGSDYPIEYRVLGAIALFASMTNIVSGFLITERMLKMFKQTRREDNT